MTIRESRVLVWTTSDLWMLVPAQMPPSVTLSVILPAATLPLFRLLREGE